MRHEVRKELKRLEELISGGQLDSRGVYTFFDEWDWEDDYSHNEISEFQYEFNKEAEKYLKKNCEGKYLIRESHIATKQFVEDRITMKAHWTLC